jgi:hypothetical protein
MLEYFKRQSPFLLCLITVHFFSIKAMSQEVRCPQVIADKESGTYQVKKRGRSNSPFKFQCFKNERAAEQKRYIPENSITQTLLGAWWRMGVVLTKNTCPNTTLSDTTVTIFFQLKDEKESNTIFAEVCPGDLKFVGRRFETSFFMTAEKFIENDDFCPDDQTVLSYQIDVTNLTATGSKATSYKRIKRCLRSSSLTTSSKNFCVTEWAGIAFKETAHAFPNIPEDINAFQETCDVVQKECVRCHAR